MDYKEPYIIPAELFENPRLFPAAKILWAFIAKSQKKKEERVNKEFASFLNISRATLIRLKAHLAAHGYLEKRVSKGQIRYLPIDPVLKAQRKIELFMTVTRFFKEIPSSLLLSLLNEDPEKLLFVLEVLEWTYRKASDPPRYPDRLLKKAYHRGVNPDPDYNPGFWELEIRHSELLKARIEIKKQADQSRAEDLKTHFKFSIWLESASVADIMALRKLAIEKLNGGAPKEEFLREPLIKIEMSKIWEDQHERN
ncbi:MAG: hypothetical protein M0Z48_04405 [Nitrospiraceae bacterium]|nr:hypothetical protein [Nitrospiraceae bacterium]